MNRHQRRANARHPINSGNKEPNTQLLTELSNIGSDKTETATIEFTPSASSPPNQRFLARLFSKILLSRFVLSRVRQPEVEKLLMSVAIEAGRQDVVDELIRRQATRDFIITL